MLILYVLGTYKKFKHVLFILLLSLLLSFFFKIYVDEFSFFLIFNYFCSIIFFCSIFFFKTNETEVDFNHHAIYYIINYGFYCFFLILYIISIFQMYIYLSIFDFHNVEYLAYIFLFAIQSRLLFFQKQYKTQVFINIIDFVLISSLLFFQNYNTYLTIVIYLYSFRLFRILTLVPYFDSILSAIWKGFRISFHFVVAFFIIIFLLSINSRILFSKNLNSNDIPTILISFYNNFKISLGNGFDISSSYSDNSLIIIYIISMTFIMGVLFTSIFTALITDGLIKDDDLNDDSFNFSNKNNWYLKDSNESFVSYLIRLNSRIASL